MEAQDQGFIELFGENRNFGSPRDAIDAGIGMVHQHFTLVPTLTVLENLILGSALAGRGMLRLGAARRAIADMAASYRIAVDLDAKVSQLSVGAQQRIEILKALVRGAKVLILDEPTAVLTPQEVAELSVTLREQARKGLAIFIVTHKLAEVMELADRVSVMRMGHLVGTWTVAETSPEQLVAHMIGRSRQTQLDRLDRPPGLPVLYLDDVHALGDRGRNALNGTTLTVNAGEIAASPASRYASTSLPSHRPVPIARGTSSLTAASATAPPEILGAGVAHAPQDRHRDGLRSISVAENAILIEHGRARFHRYGLIARDNVASFADELIKSFDIRRSGGGRDARSVRRQPR